MADNVLVSVCVLAYNHEKYIRECLDSIVSQKTNFRYEVIVHDDSSTDSTATILKDYSERYPDLFVLQLADENRYSRGVSILDEFLFPSAKGKYIALLEGDDYWTDPLKLSKQVNALERHPECHICVHSTDYVDEQGNSLGFVQPVAKVKGGRITSDDFFSLHALSRSSRLYFHTSSYLMRSCKIDEWLSGWRRINTLQSLSDYPYLLYFAAVGDYWYLDDCMSAYRQSSQGSWSETVLNNKEKLLSHHNRAIDFLMGFNRKTDGKWNQEITTIILQHEYIIASLNGDYRAMARKEYKACLKQEGFRAYVAVHVHSCAGSLKRIFSVKNRE